MENFPSNITVIPMNRKYSDSLFPWGIGASFVIALLALMSGGALVGVFLGPFLEQKNFKQGGGIILLVMILVIVVGPMIYNKRVSRFERERIPLKKIDHFGIIQGLRGAFIRLLLYDEGIEIRAFYHRYYLPFEIIDGVSIERILFCNRINIKTIIEGVPEFLTLPDKQLSDLASIIQNKIWYNKANSADPKSRAAD
jgi:hypothetical protein